MKTLLFLVLVACSAEVITDPPKPTTTHPRAQCEPQVLDCAGPRSFWYIDQECTVTETFCQGPSPAKCDHFEEATDVWYCKE